MTDDTNLISANIVDIIDHLSRYVYESMIALQQQHPEWLKPDFRYVEWNDRKYDLIKEQILISEINTDLETDELEKKVKQLLIFFSYDPYFESSDFIQLLAKFRQINQDYWTNKRGIAIMLMDTENLQIDVETETFLQTTICKYPLEVKKAFADWQNPNMRKQKPGFEKRQYQIINVAPGQNQADLAMTADGAAILHDYPHAKEVLVCSSDNHMEQLCQVLQRQQLKVYVVSRKGLVIKVLDRATGEFQTHILQITTEKFIDSIKKIILSEIKPERYNYWVLLSKVSKTYQERANLSLKEAVIRYGQCQSEKDFFSKFSEDFAIHELPNQPEIYVTLFKSSNSMGLNHSLKQTIIDSESSLKASLIKIINTLTANSKVNYIDIARVGGEFSKKHGETVTDTLERLGLNVNFKQFLQSDPIFDVQLIKGGWQVAIAPS